MSVVMVMFPLILFLTHTTILRVQRMKLMTQGLNVLLLLEIHGCQVVMGKPIIILNDDLACPSDSEHHLVKKMGENHVDSAVIVNIFFLSVACTPSSWKIFIISQDLWI